jgi:lipoate---protein ligase
MYAVVLHLESRPELRDITRAHAYVLGRLVAGLTVHAANVVCAGTSDLAIVDDSTTPSKRKFSGNSLRTKRTHLLYHGTLLYDFDLSLISACLRSPPRQPSYRAARDHADFVVNLPLTRRQLHDALAIAFPTSEPLIDWPRSRVVSLAAERFSRDSWNLTFG